MTNILWNASVAAGSEIWEIVFRSDPDQIDYNVKCVKCQPCSIITKSFKGLYNISYHKNLQIQRIILKIKVIKAEVLVVRPRVDNELLKSRLSTGTNWITSIIFVIFIFTIFSYL